MVHSGSPRFSPPIYGRSAASRLPLKCDQEGQEHSVPGHVGSAAGPQPQLPEAWVGSDPGGPQQTLIPQEPMGGWSPESWGDKASHQPVLPPSFTAPKAHQERGQSPGQGVEGGNENKGPNNSWQERWFFLTTTVQPLLLENY